MAGQTEEIKLNLTQDFSIESLTVRKVEPHTHDFLELAYIEEGFALHSLDGAEVSLRKNDYILLDYGLSHSYSSPQRGVKIVNCLFKPEFIDASLSHSRNLADLMNHYLINIGFELSHRTAISSVFHDEDGKVRGLLREMSHEYASKETGFLPVIRCLLIEILILTMRKIQKEQRIRVAGDEIAEMMAIIRADCRNHPTLQDFAARYHRSAGGLCRKFQQRSGYSFTEYVQLARVEQACRLLGNSAKKVTEIAEDCGYADNKAFHSVFKKLTGATPAQYRRSLR